MDSKKYVAVLYGITTLLLLTNAFINYKYDLYGIFDKNFDKPRFAYINQRYAKMEYLLNEGKGKFDTIIFGSSRSEGIVPSNISDKTYSLTYSSGIPNDYLRDLKTLIDNGVKLQTIYLGIDEFDYKKNPLELSNSINYVGYGTFSQNLKYKLSLLFCWPGKKGFQYMTKTLKDYETIYYIDKDGSRQGFEKSSNKIDWHKYVNDRKFNEPTGNPEKNARIAEVIKEIQEIKSLCDVNGIDLEVYFTPTHITTYLSDDIDNLNEFKRQLANVVEFKDFSTINFMTINNCYWQETSHAGRQILEMVTECLLNKNIDKMPQDFCIVVSKGNVDDHLNKMKRLREEYIASAHEQYIPK